MLETITHVAASAALTDDMVARVLNFARRHLDCDVVWVSRTTPSGEIVEHLDGSNPSRLGARVGEPAPNELGARIVGGEESTVLADASIDGGEESSLRCDLGELAYAVTALRLPDGSRYGSLVCLRTGSTRWLRPRDAQFLDLTAALLAPSLAASDAARERREQIRTRVRAVLDQGGPTMVYQPIQHLCGRRTVAVEALARFPLLQATTLGDDPLGEPGPTRFTWPTRPQDWFTEAAEVGLGVDLEIAAVRAALDNAHYFSPDVAIAVNVSAATLPDPRLSTALAAYDGRRVIIEITEHDPIVDYHVMAAACARLRAIGCRIAVDDAGAGYAGFRHLIELRPDLIKLDYHITHHLDLDHARIAMARALVSFAADIGSTVLAEGLETPNELAVATDLGIRLGQGYHLGHPLPVRGSIRGLQAPFPDPIDPTSVRLPESVF